MQTVYDIIDYIRFIYSWITETFTAIVQFFTELWSDILNFIETIQILLDIFFSYMGGLIVYIITSVWDYLVSVWQGFVSIIKFWVSLIALGFNKVIEWIGAAYRWTISALDYLIDFWWKIALEWFDLFLLNASIVLSFLLEWWDVILIFLVALALFLLAKPLLFFGGLLLGLLRFFPRGGFLRKILLVLFGSAALGAAGYTTSGVLSVAARVVLWLFLALLFSALIFWLINDLIFSAFLVDSTSYYPRREISNFFRFLGLDRNNALFIANFIWSWLGTILYATGLDVFLAMAIQASIAVFILRRFRFVLSVG